MVKKYDGKSQIQDRDWRATLNPGVGKRAE